MRGFPLGDLVKGRMKKERSGSYCGAMLTLGSIESQLGGSEWEMSWRELTMTGITGGTFAQLHLARMDRG